MAEIVWTAEAQRWLKDIHDYIATDNPDAAYRTVSAILERAQTLLAFPEMGHDHYRIAYLIRPHRDIDVLGVFHGSLDIERYLV